MRPSRSSLSRGIQLLGLALVVAGSPSTAEEHSGLPPASPPESSQQNPQDTPSPALPAHSSESPAPDPKEATDIASSPAPLPVYVPPRRGQPRARVGGAVRGEAPRLPTPVALVPDHVALTVRAQPTLFWELDSLPPASVPLVFSLMSELQIDPLIQVDLERPARSGLQRIDLADYEIELAIGREYQWAVAIVPDRERRSHDRLTLGWIRRIDAADVAIAESAEADAATLAAAGLWYDAIDSASPAEREALLEQIGVHRTAKP